MIKLTKLLFLLSIIVLIGACGGEDDTNPTGGNDSLEGEWTATSFVFEADSSTDFGGTTTLSNTMLEAATMDYDLTITESAYTTSGGYTIDISASANGTNVPVPSQSYSNITGNGTYTTDGSKFISNGSFFDVTVNGISTNVGGGEQSADFEINSAGELIFTQNETTQTNTNGVVTESIMTSISVWTRK